MIEIDSSVERLDLENRLIVLMGPEGSGKTTIGKKLAEASDLPYITTSGILHDLADNDPGPLGEKM